MKSICGWIIIFRTFSNRIVHRLRSHCRHFEFRMKRCCTVHRCYCTLLLSMTSIPKLTCIAYTCVYVSHAPMTIIVLMMYVTCFQTQSFATLCRFFFGIGERERDNANLNRFGCKIYGWLSSLFSFHLFLFRSSINGVYCVHKTYSILKSVKLMQLIRNYKKKKWSDI